MNTGVIRYVVAISNDITKYVLTIQINSSWRSLDILSTKFSTQEFSLRIFMVFTTSVVMFIRLSFFSNASFLTLVIQTAMKKLEIMKRTEIKIAGKR